MKRVFTLAIVALAAVSSFAAKELTPGSKAPEIKVNGWVKGNKVEKFEADKVYVVEFWATWCGPCKTSIPHLTEMAKKYKDVQFTGVSIWENGEDIPGQVTKFVDSMGEKMDYNVAYDLSTFMNDEWMVPASARGIPTAFIVKGDTVQWIGHPMEMEKPLEEVVSGKFDVKAAHDKFVKELAAEKKAQEEAKKALAKFDEPRKAFIAGDKSKAGKMLDELIKKDKRSQSDALNLMLKDTTTKEGNKDYGVFMADRLVPYCESDAILLYYLGVGYNGASAFDKASKVLATAMKVFEGSEMAKDENYKSLREAIVKQQSVATEGAKGSGH